MKSLAKFMLKCCLVERFERCSDNAVVFKANFNVANMRSKLRGVWGEGGGVNVQIEASMFEGESANIVGSTRTKHKTNDKTVNLATNVCGKISGFFSEVETKVVLEPTDT